MGKKIIISINTSWNIYNFRTSLLNHLINDGYQIFAVAPKDKSSQKLETLGYQYLDLKLNNKGTNPLQDIALIWEYFRVFKKVKPDVVLLYTIKPNIYGNIAAKMLGIPVISNVSGLGTVFLNRGLTSIAAKLLYRCSIRFARKVFFQNKSDFNLFVKRGIVKANKCDLVPGSGIDTKRFSPQERDKQDDRFIFTFIARLVKDKGFYEFIEASKQVYQQIPNCRFQILGEYYKDNPTAITEKEMEAILSLDYFEYLGYHDDVFETINMSDCIVLPSYREGLSRVLLEAASMAKPIITTDVPGCREVVTHGWNGFLCNPKSSISLSKQMLKMCNLDKEEKTKMGLRGRAFVIKNYHEQMVIDKYNEQIMQICT